MPGSLWYPFRQGDRSEYLALYILSALGIVVPVPRQEDIGADFYCSLADLKENRLTFHMPYIVQAKSRSVREISYGGVSEKGMWKKEEVDWLFSQELPLLIGMVDKERLTLDLYSTSNIWAACYTQRDCGQVVLIPDRVDSHEQVAVPSKRPPATPWPADIGDGYVWEVPLGPPVVSISIDDIEDETSLVRFRGVLSQAVDLDQTNITYRRLNAHYSRWLHQFTTNEISPSQLLGVFYAWNVTPGAHTSNQLQALAPILLALANNYKAQGRTEELGKLKATFELLSEHEIPKEVKSRIPELFS
jgi:hypothetical protein